MRDEVMHLCVRPREEPFEALENGCYHGLEQAGITVTYLFVERRGDIVLFVQN